jgi:hypothetical protein
VAGGVPARVLRQIESPVTEGRERTVYMALGRDTSAGKRET